MNNKQAVAPARALLGLVAALVVASALRAPDAAAKDEWVSQHFRDHPLAGTIWTGDFQPATIQQVEAAVAKADFVLLGETHTNPDHHRLQAQMIGVLARNGRQPAVVFEMIPANLQADLDRHIEATSPVEASGLGKVLRWEERGWPDWAIYQPIAEAALAGSMPLKAGSLDREAQKAVSKGEPQLLEQLGLKEPLAPQIAEAQAKEIKEGHCNLLPDNSVEPMIRVQRARDAHLAQAMLAARPEDGAVLIAGAGHVRRDWAVPPVLRRVSPEKPIVSIAFFEVDEKLSTPADYVQALDGLPKPYDFLYFTPKADLTDHCAELEKHFKAKKAKQGG
jgi:uncharacterized iron-regulated protein